MRKKSNLLIVLVYISCLLGIGMTAAAQENENTDGVGRFSYKVILPDNQRENAGYFDLKMAPSQKQKVQIELYNPSPEKPIKIDIQLNSTKTNSNGVLEYGPTDIKNDASLKYDFVKIVKAPKEIEIQPNEKEMLELEIEMPKESYDGMIAGGIQLQAIPGKDEKEQVQNGLVNKYAYLIAMLLSETETPVEPEIQFNSFSSGLSNYRNAVYLNFSNIKSTFFAGMAVDVQIMRKGSKEVIYDTKKTEMKMAPNSMVDFPIMMNGDSMEPGKYTGHALISVGDKKWEWTEDFTITKEEAEKYNAQDVSLVQERGIEWQLIAMIVAGVLGFFVLIFVIIRMINKKKRKKKRRKNK